MLKLKALGSSAVNVGQKRFLNVQEHTSKSLLDKFGCQNQRFRIVKTAEEAREAFNAITRECKTNQVVVKAQILAGGRGKGRFVGAEKDGQVGSKKASDVGGVMLTKSADECAQLVKYMVGRSLRTKQTGAEGVPVRRVMIAEAMNIVKETYFAILMDRSSPTGIVLMGSPKGGMDIEKVAEETPELIFKVNVNSLNEGPTEEQCLGLAKNLQFKGEQAQQAASEMRKLYEMFVKLDATQIEINPLGQTDKGQVMAFDAKLNFDDNAEFRHLALHKEARDESIDEEDPRERLAREANLNYISLKGGNIGCLVNGAGLAMATMDIINLYGKSKNIGPANFLDVGGSATTEQVRSAFKLIMSDENVKAILVNIFGGIMKCDVIASGIVEAMKDLKKSNMRTIPLVVRLSGTNVQEGKRILAESKLDITSADDLDQAAQKAVKAVHA
ncbi:hypothetical protein MP228_005357 [Amoeboaphelidium protococcarum]|nr:hypothetical protein MP228_006034 [Amoeboaphelidium protococcarum]KAI3649725.1 hypothetical protein MP228_005357 [Amoeboaphelidium protococcarum]